MSQDVFNLLSDLDGSKASGSDGLCAKILKFCSLAVYEPITHVFNSSLQVSTFPSEWKIHRICPVPKRGDLALSGI